MHSIVARSFPEQSIIAPLTLFFAESKKKGFIFWRISGTSPGQSWKNFDTIFIFICGVILLTQPEGVGIKVCLASEANMRAPLFPILSQIKCQKPELWVLIADIQSILGDRSCSELATPQPIAYVGAKMSARWVLRCLKIRDINPQFRFVTIIPILIGGGQPLFGELDNDIKLKLIRSQAFGSGMVQNHYQLL